MAATQSSNAELEATHARQRDRQRALQRGTSRDLPPSHDNEPRHPTSLLSDSRLAVSYNRPVLVSLMRQMHQTYGNRTLQSILRDSVGATGKPKPPVQTNVSRDVQRFLQRKVATRQVSTTTEAGDNDDIARHVQVTADASRSLSTGATGARGEPEANSAQDTPRPVPATPVTPASGSVSVQRFTADLDGDKVVIKPEKKDNDKDLDRVLCKGITKRKIAGQKSIDVTSCLPEATAKSLSLGPYNCAEFVRNALGQKPPKGDKQADWLLTEKLWKELLKSGYKIRGFGVLKKDGTVEKAEGISWKQLDPKMGDLVFMKGQVNLKKGAKEPDQSGDQFTVNWDHVGIFIVRSRGGNDYHLAKDGDENPLGVYHTGSGEEDAEMAAPGAYVKGVSSLMAYLEAPAPAKK